MKNSIVMVLGGGRGTRLQPLTSYRSKPAVPLAGKYRLIDIPISNCINSGLNRIYVLTQFLSVSLHRHIRGTYTFDAFSGGYVEILAAQQTVSEDADWYQGTADAVRKNLRYLMQPDIDQVLILSGDQLYRFDFSAMMANHRASGADVTIAAKPVEQSQASALGIMRTDAAGRVVGFLEKPQTAEELGLVRTDPDWIESQGVPSHGRDLLASMGIYLFKRDALVDALTKTDYQDFGKEVFPASIRSRKVQVHLFDGYWEDIGTIRSFYEANLALARETPPFELMSPKSPIFSRPRFLPPTQVNNVTIQNSLVADGCTIDSGTRIENSVIGLRCRIGRNVVIRNSIVMGADFYESTAGDGSADGARIGIGDGSVIDGAIIDKNCRIGANVQIGASHAEDCVIDEHCVVRDGVLVVRKNASIAEGRRL